MHHPEHQKTVLKSGLTPQQRQEMRLWLLTQGKKGVAHHNVVYSRYDPDNVKKNGHNAFLEFSQTSLYKKYIGDVEENLIGEYGYRIAKWIPKRCKELIEMGPGNQKITKYFKKIFLPTERREQIQYRPADVAKSAIDEGYSDAEKAGFKKGSALLGDRNDLTTFSHVQDAFYLCFGGGFVNGYDGISQRIATMQGSGYLHRGRVFSTFFGMPGDDSLEEDDKVLLLKAIYGDLGTDMQSNPFADQESYQKARDMILQPFEALGFDTHKLDLGVEREKGEPAKILLGARVLQPFTEREGNETYTYETGDFIPLIDSPRPTLAQYTQKVEQGGGKVIDSFTVDGAVGTITELPRKKLSKKDSKILSTASALVGTLLLMFGGLQTGKMLERADRHKKQEKLKQEIVMGKDGTVNNAYTINEREQESEKMLYTFEHRYGNSLTDETRETLSAMMNDFLLSEKGQQFLNKYKRMGGGPDYYDHLYIPTIIHQFIAENPTQLKNLHINTVAHSNLLQHYEALRNTYFYQGDVVSFENNDVEEIGIYRAEHVGWVTGDDHPDTGEPDGISVKCGIVKRKGKEYFVQKLGNDPYRLSEKNSTLRSQGILSSGDMAAEILSKGQTQIITEKVYTMLVNQYGDKYPMYVNGREEIARWLLDWYAQGGDLEFLMYATEKNNYFGETILKNFILRVCIPEIGPVLQKSMSANEIKRNEIDTDAEKEGSVVTTIQSLGIFLDTYLGSRNTIQSGLMKSTLVRLLLTDDSREKIDMCDPQIVRAWVTKHAQTFRENGIMVTVFPEWIEKFLAHTSSPQYFPEDNFTGLKEKQDVELSYSGVLFGNDRADYVDIDGNAYNCGIYSKNIFGGEGRLVARVVNKKIKNTLWNEYQQGNLPQPSISTGRGSFYITEKTQVIAHLIKNHTSFSSANVHAIMRDYKQWKDAMEKVKD